MIMRIFEWLDAHAAIAVGAVLALTTLLAIVRLLLRHSRAQTEERVRSWRLVLLVAAQPLSAALLYLALVPPAVPGSAGTLVVATHGTTSGAWREKTGDVRVALPEAPQLPDAERVPDLATALRRYPATRRVLVLGGGLEARDLDPLQGRALAFEPGEPPRGIVELEVPVQAAAGAAFDVAGRVHGLAAGEVELLDPASRRVDRATLREDGRFKLSATARVPGAAIFGVRVRDARKHVVESADVPIVVVAPTPPRVLLLAGAAGAELKYLRRWAEDAGLPVHAQIDFGGGLQGGDAPIALNATSLARFDLVVLDERAWSSLGGGQRAALTAAVRDGLGMLVRLTAAPSSAERGRLRALGFAIDGGRDTAEVRLTMPVQDADALRARIGPGIADAPRAQDAEVPAIPTLTRRALRIAAADGVTLHADARGAPLTVWRSEGRGRVGVSSLTDSHRLVLAGRADVHAELWSDAAAVLARARAASTIEISGSRVPGERVVLCGLASGARAVSPDGSGTALIVDPSTGARACTAFFPRVPGWHRVQSSDRAELFHVRAADTLPGVRAAARRDATMRAAVEAPARSQAAVGPAPRHPGERWPWWLAWLGVSAALWWFERSRLGRLR